MKKGFWKLLFTLINERLTLLTNRYYSEQQMPWYVHFKKLTYNWLLFKYFENLNLYILTLSVEF